MQIRHIYYAGVLALAACGGGGGGDSGEGAGNPTPTSSPNFVVSRDVRLITTVDYDPKDPGNTTTFTAAKDTSVLPQDSSTSLSQYTLDNGVNQRVINTSGIKSGGLFNLTVGTSLVNIGGTQWNYSRFGYLLDMTSSMIGQNKRDVMRHMPFFRANTDKSPAITTANYQTSGLSVGNFVMDDFAYGPLSCVIGVKFTKGTDDKQTAEISLSACNLNDTSSKSPFKSSDGTLLAQKTSNTSEATTSLGTSPLHIVYLDDDNKEYDLKPTNYKVSYALAGPNAEEMVGSIYLNGTFKNGTTDTPFHINMAFGAKK